jgi:hypothetical protein
MMYLLSRLYIVYSPTHPFKLYVNYHSICIPFVSSSSCICGAVVCGVFTFSHDGCVFPKQLNVYYIIYLILFIFKLCHHLSVYI